MRVANSFDVARLAGVSQPTVSRALRNVPGVAPATRDRVLAAARELSYIASDKGRALSTRRTRRVAVVSAELTNPYYPELVEPIRRHLDARGYRTVVVADQEPEGVTLEALVDGSYDGVLLTTTTRASSLPRELTEYRVPHVLVNRLLDRADSPSCGIDNAHGSQQVATLLATLGHTRIGVIGGPSSTSTGRERTDGLRHSLRQQGISLPRHHVVRCDYSHDGGQAAALQLLESSEPPTAIACGNDVIAFGVLSAARMLGVVVPNELTVVGFDDIAAAQWPLAALTTVHCDLDALARGAVQSLLSRMSAPNMPVPAPMRIEPHLVLRSTHGPPPAQLPPPRPPRLAT